MPRRREARRRHRERWGGRSYLLGARVGRGGCGYGPEACGREPPRSSSGPASRPAPPTHPPSMAGRPCEAARQGGSDRGPAVGGGGVWRAVRSDLQTMLRISGWRGRADPLGKNGERIGGRGWRGHGGGGGGRGRGSGGRGRGRGGGGGWGRGAWGVVVVVGGGGGEGEVVRGLGGDLEGGNLEGGEGVDGLHARPGRVRVRHLPRHSRSGAASTESCPGPQSALPIGHVGDRKSRQACKSRQAGKSRQACKSRQAGKPRQAGETCTPWWRQARMGSREAGSSIETC
jgi:hypothetical protein